MKTLEKTLLFAILLSIAVSLIGFTRTCEDIGQKVFRLHVLANSDSEDDQALKLKVRDRILECSEAIFDSSADKEDVERQAAEFLPLFQVAAEAVIHENGYEYPVHVELTNMYFNTRHYENVTLPAGMYDALRVTIGEAKGQNWWCVMYPPMCLPAAEEEQVLSDVLDDSQMNIVTDEDTYEVKFKIVEIYEEVKNLLNQEAS